MNTPTITMERDAALQKLNQYEEAACARPGAVRPSDREIIKGYRVLAKGGRLVDVNAAISSGGLNLAGIPKLAIARADQAETTWRGDSDGSSRFWWVGGYHSYRYRGNKYSWGMPAESFPGAKFQWRDYRALTPLIPLPLRPVHSLSNYFLLWEASWTPAPPTDPYLLRPITGTLMEIIAEWELSPLEVAAVRAAMKN